MPRFVLLYHDCPPTYPRPSHWDLMLETGDVLRTWALEKLPRDWKVAHAETHRKYPLCPALAADNEVVAEQLADHRREYLEFEGNLTNNRGSVIRVAAGTYEVVAESPHCFELSMTNGGSVQQLRLTRSSTESIQWQLKLRTAS